MNRHAILHKSDSLYSFALTPDTAEIRLRAAKGDISIADVIYGQKHEFSLHRKIARMNISASDGLFDYFTIRLNLDDKRLAYIFLLTDNEGNKYYYSEDGLTETYDFSVAFYNFFQLAYLNGNDIFPRCEWLSRAVVYQIFVDRFHRGVIPENSVKSSETAACDDFINLKWGDKPTSKSFAGGNLDGIAQKLDYICDLGVNTLYLTPIFTSRSNHKYDISDYFSVDPHFGGNAAFDRLMTACKARGIRVILDAVFNHCSEDIKQFRDVCEKGKRSPYFDWFVIYGEKPTKRPLNYEVFASCDYMPKWNTANPEVQEYLCSVGEYWIKEYGIDGWRLDVSDEVSHEFWRKFRKRIKAIGADKVLIGENWHDSSSYLCGDQFDSIMNYAFTKAMLDYFVYKKLDTAALCDKLNELMMRNVTQANLMMLNLLDSHDTHRFYTECGKDENKLLLALAVETFMPGATMVYYGTEIPLEGGYDPDSRRCFIWGEHSFSKRVKELLKYKRLRALTDGDAVFREQNGAIVIERITDGQKVTLIVNNSDSSVCISDTSVKPFCYKVIVE
ncbi:MAG: glycoside hydrolase family 13 protein [Clostridiales bacterium]|nr:glycoside hydrolase family 13 protein [Clostridiales bacterium]